MRIHVECHAERSGDGPRRFVLGEHTIEVDDLLDRWYGNDADYFRVRGADGHFYVLKHHREPDGWEPTLRTPRSYWGVVGGAGEAAGAEHHLAVLHDELIVQEELDRLGKNFAL